MAAPRIPPAGGSPSSPRAGVEVINISPMRDDGPDAVRPEWIPIRPNTDTAMLLALTHTLVSEGLHDREFLERFCVGFERVRPYLMGETDGQPKDADWAASITGVPAETIRALARRMAEDAHDGHGVVVVAARASRRAALLGGGAACVRARPDRLAGRRLRFRLRLGRRHRRCAAVVHGAGDGRHQESDQRHHPDGAHLRLPAQSRRAVTTSTASAAIIRTSAWSIGPAAIRSIITRTPTSCAAPWQRPETIVVHEPWWTATARHADIVLPATTSLERNDIGGARRDKFIIAMQQAVEPVGEARNDFDIFSELAQRLGYADAYTQGRDEMAWLRHLYEHAATAPAPTPRRCRTSIRSGRTAIWKFRRPADEYVLFGDFRADPDKHKLRTPSGRIELYSEKIAGFGYDDCPPHATWIEPWEWLGGEDAKTYPLHLVSSQPRDRLHSQMDCGPVSAGGKVAGREAITINPADATARGIGARRRGARSQRARLVPRRRHRQRHGQRGRGELVLRRLVRPGRRRRDRRSACTAMRMCSRATRAPRSSGRGRARPPRWSRSSATPSRSSRSRAFDPPRVVAAG